MKYIFVTYQGNAKFIYSEVNHQPGEVNVESVLEIDGKQLMEILHKEKNPAAVCITLATQPHKTDDFSYTPESAIEFLHYLHLLGPNGHIPEKKYAIQIETITQPHGRRPYCKIFVVCGKERFVLSLFNGFKDASVYSGYPFLFWQAMNIVMALNKDICQDDHIVVDDYIFTMEHFLAKCHNDLRLTNILLT